MSDEKVERWRISRSGDGLTDVITGGSFEPNQSELVVPASALARVEAERDEAQRLVVAANRLLDKKETR